MVIIKAEENERTASVPGVAPKNKTAGVKEATSAAYLERKKKSKGNSKGEREGNRGCDCVRSKVIAKERERVTEGVIV